MTISPTTLPNASPIGGSVLPIVEDQTLIPSRVVEEERVHSAGGGVARREVAVDERGCGAVSIRRIRRIAVGAHAALEPDVGDDEVAVH